MCFPLWFGPPELEPLETIVIALVYNCHFKRLTLRDDSPMPLTHALWRTYKRDSASIWQDLYLSRQQPFLQHFHNPNPRYINVDP